MGGFERKPGRRVGHAPPLRVHADAYGSERLDIVPELDLLAVAEVDGYFEFSTLGNGKIRETASGARTETIGPKNQRSTYDRQLSVTKKELDILSRILREQQGTR